jgi:hypothetical protein
VKFHFSWLYYIKFTPLIQGQSIVWSLYELAEKVKLEIDVIIYRKESVVAININIMSDSTEALQRV